MRKWILSIAGLVILPAGLFAQDITGTWQGVLQAGKELRTVIKISKDPSGALKATLYSIDQGGGGIPVSSVTVQGSVVKMSVPGIGGSYEGKLDSDGVNLTGNWTQGPKPLVLNLKHVKDGEAWEIPAPPPRLKPMAADANAVFEVATIKPSKPGNPGKAFTMRGRQFVTINTNLREIITFAYDMHPRQVVGGAGWLDSDFYDIQAEPEPQGMPNTKQIKVMVQKLLADRYKLAFHREKRELSAYAIVVGKGGPKMAKNDSDPNGMPGMFFRGLGVLPVRNATMADFATVLQNPVLDRPVVDQTGLTGRYDFLLKWTPDASQFNGMGANAKHDDADAPPDLFTAMQEQLGLQLKSVKAPVDVLVIDRVEKPSEN